MGSIVCPPDPYIRIPNEKVKRIASILIIFSPFVAPFPKILWNTLMKKEKERGKGMVSTTNHL